MALNSGTTAIATTDDSAIAVLDTGSVMVSRVYVINEGAAPGFVSIDNGESWLRIPASGSRTIDISHSPRAVVVKVKRVASGANLGGIWANAD
jgi:hypothetical protein